MAFDDQDMLDLDYESARLDGYREAQARIATLEAELTRCRTTEQAAAHALDVMRQYFGLDLIRGEHPADTARRIVREDDRQTNGAIRIADEAIDGTVSALEAEVAELREVLSHFVADVAGDECPEEPDDASIGWQDGEPMVTTFGDIRRANRLLNKEDGK